jgi:U1 small nuclear ribonucleoprotein
MAHYLPPAIMRFFKERPAAPHKVPIKKTKPIVLTGCAQFVERFKDPMKEPVVNETFPEKRAKRKAHQIVRQAKRLAKAVEAWDPKAEEKQADKTEDAYKTLFVSRLSYDVSAEDLKYEFEYYGSISKATVVKDKKEKSRGYAFVSFERSKDLKEAYKDADGRKINGRRILVDVERGRTVKNWKPRRLGGGLGGTRIGGKEVNQKFSGREPPKTESGARSSYRPRSSRDDRSGRSGGSERRPSSRSDRGSDRSRSDRGDRGRDRERGRDRDRASGGDRERRR